MMLLDFSDENTARLSSEKLYDALKSNGLIDLVLDHMNETEYADLYAYIMKYQEDVLDYKNTAGAVLQSVIQDLPKNAQMAADIVNNFDQAVVDFATAANGGRNIETNQ